ncbi:hypothetical protein GGI25_002289 [Coemansia spiralis]|uniref:Uncharacterized protein n=2 Tax=Coemansia TaxID=4863 RepID=A0A9W8G933_9FUNG|nr:hypothetical protein GGI25_002289 [Coemansia spiralis]
MVLSESRKPALLATVLVIASAIFFLLTCNAASVVDLTDYPSILYVATPFTVCFGAFITKQTVITDARCLYPFQNTSGVPDQAKGTLGPEYLMVALPTVNTSATLHSILLSTQVYTAIDQAGSRASTFFGLAANYVDNSTFFAVKTSAVHAYYPQSQYVESAEQNFDVGILTLKRPIDGAQPCLLQLDDLDAKTAGLSAITFAPPTTTKDAATLQQLYQGIDLTKVSKIDVGSLDRSTCDSDYMKAFGLKNMHSFSGHSLPDKQSPVYCSSMYDNTTKCQLDTSISISDSASNSNSISLNSTLFFVESGSTLTLVSIGLPHLFEVRSDNSDNCDSNGFIYFPRTSIYTDWIGWASNGSFASNGSWINKPLTGDVISDYVTDGNANGLYSFQSTMLIAALSIFAAIASTF